jgi:multidrug resistance efflux pump
MWNRPKRHDVQTAEREIAEARQRLEAAQRALAQAREDDGRVEQVTRKLHELRRRNNFGAAIGAAIRGDQ